MEFLRHIPILLIAFLVFLVLLNVRIRKSNKEQQSKEDAFWERERLANSTRRQDISNLPYITIPAEILPQSIDSAAAKKLRALAESEERILNLTGKSNTDLKLEYGVANLEELSACDDRYAELVTSIADCSKDLIDAEKTEEAKALLEFGISIDADIKAIYLRLAHIYIEEGNVSEIDRLIASAENLNTLSKNGIIADLKALT